MYVGLEYDMSNLILPTKISKIAFWMRKYGSMSWKRTWVWANSRCIVKLDKGPLTSKEKETARPTTTKYIDKNGVTKFKGNSTLKKSQILSFAGDHAFLTTVNIVFP